MAIDEIAIQNRATELLSIAQQLNAAESPTEKQVVQHLSTINNYLNSEQLNIAATQLYPESVSNSISQLRQARTITENTLDQLRNNLEAESASTEYINGRLSQIDSEGAGQINSAGQIVRNSQDAYNSDSLTQNPMVVKNAQLDTIKRQIQEDANVYPPHLRTRLGPGEDSGADILNRYNGNDNNDTSFVNNTDNEILTPNAFNKQVIPQKNVLNRLGSYVYKISLYVQTPEQYIGMMASADKSTANYSVILESGGSAAGPTTATDPLKLDLYINNLEIEHLFQEANRAPVNSTLLHFDIIEPMGFTFLTNLKTLVDSLGLQDFSKQHYLLVVRFKGFDDSGKLISSGDKDGYLIEKFIPFTFATIKTVIKAGAVTYNCVGLVVQHSVGLSQKRATIPFNVELVGQTLNDLFNGKSDLSTVSAKAVSGRTPDGQEVPIPSHLSSINVGGRSRISTGIIEALNALQADLVKTRAYKQADVYKVKFAEGSGIGQCLVNAPGSVDKTRKPMSPTAQKDASNTLSSKGYMDTSTSTFSITAGQQIQQLLDLMIRNSEYITKQQKFIIDPVTNDVKINNVSDSILKWFKISTTVKPLEWDDARGDYAYEITYVVSPKQVFHTHSAYFNEGQFRGIHKSYQYWFTGKNSDIINFEQEINAAFYITMDGNVPLPNQKFTPDRQSMTTWSYQHKAAESQQGGAGNSADPAARAAATLYNASDFAMMTLQILGDPDYIQQTDIFYEGGQTYEAFAPDGSINYDAAEPLIEVNFNTMEDYDINTGEGKILDPSLKTAQEVEATNGAKGLIYKVVRVTSKFSQGKFTQTIIGLLREFATTAVNVRPTSPTDISTRAAPRAVSGDPNSPWNTYSEITPTPTILIGKPTSTVISSDGPEITEDPIRDY
jgi:hypothetical protein